MWEVLNFCHNYSGYLQWCRKVKLLAFEIGLVQV